MLLHCHAGCNVNEIVKAVGLEMKDLFKPKTDVHYVYQDKDGDPVFRVVRTPAKKFFQQRLNGDGGWLNGLKDVKPVIYRLPQVIKAVDAGEPVFIPEGEKDVENLREIGLTGTTNPGGAGKWRPHFAEWLHGANVVILPDNDGPGRKHGEQVAASLRGVAASVKVIELPGLEEKGDVTDWLEAGGSKEDLLQLVKAASEWKEEHKRKRKQKDDEEIPVRKTSFAESDAILYEQIYRDGQSCFVGFNSETGETEITHSVELRHEIVFPLDGEDVELGAVRLPTNVEEYGTTMTRLAAIEDHIYKYLDVSDKYRKFAAYYVLLSWLFDRFHTIPYLRALGDTGCGKSRFLDVIGGLCYKPISASGCVTPAPIYRMLRRWGGTLVLDEADISHSDEYNEVVTILNCGFEKGRPVIRATRDNPDKVQILPVYSPKVFATRRRFKDSALEARCLTEVMIETDRDDIAPVLGKDFFDEQDELRNKLLLFRFRNYFETDPEVRTSLDLSGVEPRLKQVSDAFASLFVNEAEVLASYREFILSHQREIIEQRAVSEDGRVVQTLFELFERDKSVIATIRGQQATSLTPGSIAEVIGSTPQAVGQRLKNLGLETFAMKRDGKVRRYLLYDESRFRKLRKRYIPQDEVASDGVSHTNETIATLATQTTQLPF